MHVRYILKNSDLSDTSWQDSIGILPSLSWDCHETVILVSFESFLCVIALELQDFYWCLIQSCRGSIDVASTPVRALSGQKVCVIFSIGDCDFSVHLCHFSVGEPGASVILCNSVKMSAFCQHQIWRYTQYHPLDTLWFGIDKSIGFITYTYIVLNTSF